MKIIGYFYCDKVQIGLFNEEFEGKDIKLIGNSGNTQYQLLNLLVGKSHSYIGEQSYNISKFSALNYEIVRLEREKNILK